MSATVTVKTRRGHVTFLHVASERATTRSPICIGPVIESTDRTHPLGEIVQSTIGHVTP